MKIPFASCFESGLARVIPEGRHTTFEFPFNQPPPSPHLGPNNCGDVLMATSTWRRIHGEKTHCGKLKFMNSRRLTHID